MRTDILLSVGVMLGIGVLVAEGGGSVGEIAVGLRVGTGKRGTNNL